CVGGGRCCEPGDRGTLKQLRHDVRPPARSNICSARGLRGTLFSWPESCGSSGASGRQGNNPRPGLLAASVVLPEAGWTREVEGYPTGSGERCRGVQGLSC